MKFYVISPLSAKYLMLQGDCIFALAHLYIKDAKYRKFLHKCKNNGYFITLDNGAAENSLVTEDILIDCVKDLMPHEVIAPDILFNKEQTLYSLKSFVDHMKVAKLSNRVDIMGVPQGNTKLEWIDCYIEMLSNTNISTIGLSKITVPWCFGNVKGDKRIMESRHLAFIYLKNNNLLHKPIHLLGAGDPREFKYYKFNPIIRSNDTCNWVWSAMNDISFNKEQFNRISTPYDFFEKEIDGVESLRALDNIKWVKNSIN